MLIGFSSVNPRAIPWETNDCVVRASCIAALVPYVEMWEKYKAAGRKDGRGTCVYLIDEVLPATAMYKHSKYDAPTLMQFVTRHRKGRWVMCNAKHAWAVIDGVVHDTVKVGARTRVLYAWRLD